MEQDIATLLSSLLGVTVYIIGNGEVDYLQVTKYAGEVLHCGQSRSSGYCSASVCCITIDLDFQIQYGDIWFTAQ